MKIRMFFNDISLGQFNRKPKKFSIWLRNWSHTLCVFQNSLQWKWCHWSEKGKRIWNLKKIYMYGFKPVEE